MNRHRPFEEDAVDPMGVCQGLAQPAGRLDIERQGAIAVLQIEIDEPYAALLLVGEIPGEIGSQSGRPDPAARADQGDDLAELLIDRAALADAALRSQSLCQALARDRLHKVVADPRLYQIPIQLDIVVIAERDDRHPRLAHVGQIVYPRDRQINSAQIDDQGERRPLASEVLNRLCYAPSHHHVRRFRRLRQAFPQSRLSLRVGNERHQRKTAGRQRRRLFDRRGDLQNVAGFLGRRHYLRLRHGSYPRAIAGTLINRAISAS